MGATTTTPSTAPLDSKPFLNKLMILTRTGDYEAFIEATEGYLKNHRGDVDIVASNLKDQFDFDVAKDVCRHGSFELYRYLRDNSNVDFNFDTSQDKVSFSKDRGR